MKKIFAAILITVVMITITGCEKTLESLIKTINTTLENIDYGNELESVIKPPEGSPDWSGFKMADKIMKKYLSRSAEGVLSIEELLGITSFRGGSYAGAKIKEWIGYYGQEEYLDDYEGRYYATIYFNEDCSDVWIRINPYIDVGTDLHYVNGKLVEEISISDEITE